MLATPPLKVEGLVLESVYPSIKEATDNRLRLYLGPFGGLVAPLLLGQLSLRLGISPDDLRPIDHIASVTCPILIMSGEKDRHTTAEETRAIFAGAKAPKDIWLVPRAAHVDLHKAARDEYESLVCALLNRL